MFVGDEPTREQATIIEVGQGSRDDEVLKTRSFELETIDGVKLKYLAVRHSTDPTFGQHETLQGEFLNFQPDLVMYEGPENPLVDTSRDEAIEKYGGEMGLVRWLVVQANKGLEPQGKQIEAHSFDLTSEDWISGFREGGFSNEEVAVFDVARRVYREATNAIKNKQEMSVAEERLSSQFAEPAMQGNLSYELNLVPRSDGQSWTYDLAREEYKRLTSQELTFTGNNEDRVESCYVTTLRKMFDFELGFKDKIMAIKIAEAMKIHKKVLVVAGSGHAIAQKSILENTLPVTNGME